MSDRQHAPAIQVYLLGPLRIVVAGRELSTGELPRNKAMLTLMCLLSRPNHRIAEDEAAELLWPESPPDSVAKTIGSTLTAVRSPFGWSKVRGNADLLLRGNGVIAIVPEAGVWVDADEFERLLERARRADDPGPLLEAANRLYVGEYLPAVRDASWAADRRRYLKTRRTELQFDLAQHRERQGDVAGAATALESALRDDGCDERAARELMLLHARTGRRTEALRIYQQLVAALRRDLKVEPSRETVEVWRQINDDTPPPSTQPGPAAVPPVSGGGGPAPRSAATPSAGMALAGARADDRLDPSQFTPGYPFPTPERLVGRESEIEALERIVKRGRASGQVTLIGAPAGTGKSALLGALVQRARRAGFLCLVGGGYEDEGIIPFGPFHDALSDFLLWQPAERVRAELAGGLDDLALLVPELRYHLNLPERTSSDPDGDRRRLFGSIHVYLRSLTERHPVLLCLEDLHAADAATLSLIEFLVRQMAQQRFVVVGTFRTEELRPGRPLADLVMALRRRNAEQLDLQPLNRQRTSRLVASLLEGQPSERLSSALYATTEGNPFFVEQLVLALREDGRIDRQDGTWRQIGDISGVPTIVREVVGQRLDRLSASARETLAMAAVMGQTFEYGALLAAAESDHEMGLLADLDEAFSAQILLDTPTGYAFGHAVLREVAYARLTTPRRMALHSRAGQGLEQWAGARASERAAELAHHFSLAGRAPEVRQKALRYSLIAGRRAAALSSQRDALTHFAQALKLVDELGEAADLTARIDALEGCALAERDLTRWPACIESARRLVALCADPVRRADAHGIIGYAHHHIGSTAAALAATDAGLEDLRMVTGPERPATVTSRLHLQHQKSILLFLGGRYDQIEELGAQMVRDATRLDQPRPRFWAHTSLGWAYLGQGRVAPGIAQGELACAAAESFGGKIQLAIADENLALHLLAGGRFPAARARLERAIALFTEAAGDVRAVNSIRLLARAFLAEGNLDAARQSAEVACGLVVDGAMRWSAECNDAFGAIHIARSDWEAAKQRFELALDVRKNVAYPAGAVDSLLGLGYVREATGDWQGARTMYEAAVAAADTADPGPRFMAAHRQLGRLLLRQGERCLASIHLDLALGLADRLPDLAESADTFLAGAEFALSAGDQATALVSAERGCATSTTADVALRVNVSCATLYASRGQVERAHALAADAARIARELDTPYALGLAYLGAARAAVAGAGLPDAAAAFEAAERQFTAAQMPYARAVTLADWSGLCSDSDRQRQLRAESERIFGRLGAPAPPVCAVVP